MCGDSNSRSSRRQHLDDLLEPVFSFFFFYQISPEKHTSQISLMSHAKPQAIHNGKTCSTATALVLFCTRHIRLSVVKLLVILELGFACSDVINNKSDTFGREGLRDLVLRATVCDCLTVQSNQSKPLIGFQTLTRQTGTMLLLLQLAPSNCSFIAIV